MRKINILVPILVCFCATACKKDATINNLSRSELITGSWILSGMNYSPAYDYYGNGNKVTDAYAIMEDCEKDNVITFMKDGTYENNEAGLKCNPSDPQSRAGTWSLSDDENTLIADSDFATILQLDKSVFKYTYTFTDFGTEYTQTTALKRK